MAFFTRLAHANGSEGDLGAVQPAASFLRAYQLGSQLMNWYMSHYEERGVIEDFNGWVDKLRAVTKQQVIEVAKHLCNTPARGATFLGKVTDQDAVNFAALLEPVSGT